MRHIIRVITFLFVATTLLVGCGSADKESGDESRQSETAAAKRDRAKAETKEAAQAVQDYAHTEKDEFIDQMRKELVTIREELDSLSDKIDRTSGAAKSEAQAQLESVRQKWAEAQRQLDEAESVPDSTWDDAKAVAKKSYVELKSSFEKTREWLSEKIAP